MQSPNESAIGGDANERLTATAQQLRWYAVYTAANHEKKVADRIGARDLEYYFPTYVTKRRWSDRVMRVHAPLFPGYVFVRMDMTSLLHVLSVSGVVRMVGFPQPKPLLDEEVEALRGCLAQHHEAKPHPYIGPGQRVRLRSGPLRGLEGVVLREKSNCRFVVCLDLIMRAISVEVDAADLTDCY